MQDSRNRQNDRDLIKYLLQQINQVFPRFRSVDAMAYELARYTPRMTAICIILLLLGVIASRLTLWVEGFLWGIPSLGAVSLCAVVWIWSTHIFPRPDLSAAARGALRRAMYFHLTMLIASLLAIIYFTGMGMHFW